TLWLGNGDASDWTKVDPMALRTYDEQSFAGKIIHIDRNGMGLPGHAFCPGDNDLTHVCTKLYAKGMRNPFRFTIRQGTGPVFGADYTQGYIKRLKLDSQGNVTGTIPFATGAVPVDLELGPGNELYYVDFGQGTPGTGSVQRIVYTPANRTPVPQASATPNSG